ncbi:MAG: hypothetical protein KKE02_20620 [Alphaproteobacteria bacterium]|nr:hypothetical protein [Alphaproteobacteria bacterium]MBU1514560.1 hypothetical protein [Alphaproteobacteria bacterium]MBU2096808.1 hypothetical protein [Alphaproteobacteria bacterium]MBU2153435.1 hypothetical protein [Alphaproteobacteria bacterium]MBU2306060.1 hypothetical protein [Alphaproteobacteria bacterium]
MGLGRKLALVAGAATIATSAFAQQKVTGPVAVYWMSAQTQTGFGMGGMGGGKPDAGAMMKMMMGGGGGGASKTLQLDLGSSQTNAAPAADHLPPGGLQVGPKLPLLTPKPTTGVREETPERYVPEEYQKPKGRMLIFWGCGERARPGQPYVIDFAKMAAGQQNPANLFKGIDYRPMQPPSMSRNRTYGEWPNEKTRDLVPSAGSLIGAHTIRGNYSPEINFTLEEDQDFLGALNLTSNAKAPGGWANLGWNLVGNAQAYYASAVGGGDNDTVVMWSSSETQAAAFSNPDFLSPGDINRLVANKTLMGPATKTCAVPKEVIDAAPAAMVQLVAYGGEANFVYPPRPSDPKVTWNQQWAVKVRYRSATGGILGQDMAAMMGGGGRQSGRPTPPQPGQPQQPPKGPSAADILRQGILGGGLPFPRR